MEVWYVTRMTYGPTIEISYGIADFTISQLAVAFQRFLKLIRQFS